jgi:hypothetical protein
MTDDLKDQEPPPGASFTALAKHIGDTPVAPAHGIAAIALDMAMKYHDIATVKDGALYQQYKLEGKNFRELHLDVVLETAMKIEAWLLGSSERIAKLVVDAISVAVEDEPEVPPIDQPQE